MGDVRLNDEEKKKLIEYYRNNKELWDKSDQNYNNKSRRTLMKNGLVQEFEGKFSEEQLEKTFHSLRTSFMREVKKISSGVESKWKFFDHMEFLKAESSQNKKKDVFF